MQKAAGFLLDIDPEAHHPEFKLLKADFPAVPKLSHPAAIRGGVGHINDHAHEVVSEENASVTPVAFHLLRLVAGRAELINNLQNSVSKPFRRDISAVIKL
jgi:hypothetical protein